MLQRLTFVATVEVDEPGHNWESATMSVVSILMDGSAPHHDVAVTKVIRMEVIEDEG